MNKTKIVENENTYPVLHQKLDGCEISWTNLNISVSGSTTKKPYKEIKRCSAIGLNATNNLQRI